MIFEKATDELKYERRAICETCIHKRDEFKLFCIKFQQSQCMVCLCHIKAKTSLKNEECPKGKW